MRVLITGLTGFAGRYLARRLARRRVRLYGLERTLERSGAVRDLPRLKLVRCDLRQAGSVDRAVRSIRPDLVFHLAARSSVPGSWSDPAGTLDNNLLAQLNLLESLRRHARSCRVLVAGSSEVYGAVSRGRLPVKEGEPFAPLNPYALSKVVQDRLAEQYAVTYGMRVVRTRAFSHTGPGQDARYVVSDFARQIALAEAGRSPAVLRVGNLASVRDFADVRDVVRAYELAALRGESGGVYNVCTGKGRSIRSILEGLLALSRVRIRVQTDKSRMRPGDVPVMIGSRARLARRTGWKPEIPFERTLEDLLDDWRKRI